MTPENVPNKMYNVPISFALVENNQRFIKEVNFKIIFLV